MRLKLYPSLLLALFVTSAIAAPQWHYQITPIPNPPDGYVQATGMNNRGEVIGWRSIDAAGTQQGFVWRDGTFTYLNERVGPNTSYMEPLGINDRSQIVGYFSDPATQTFRGFWIGRRAVRYIDGPPGATVVFLNQINDRELILGASYDAAGNESHWLWEDGEYSVFENFVPTGFNLRGTVSGSTYVPGSGGHAALWEDGEISIIGPAFSAAAGINDRGQVVGTMNNNGGTRAFFWDDGTLTPLPALRADQVYSYARGITNSGVISGSTVINGPNGSESIATLWRKGQPVDLNDLIHPDDPLRPYVTLTSASMNERGDILASGLDSRNIGVAYFFLERVRH